MAKLRSRAFRAAAPLAVALSASLVATAIFFSRVVFTDSVFLERDMFRVYLPVKHYWAQRVLHGQFPDWYPFDGLGQPLVGMMVSGALHPLNVLYLLFPLATAGD